MNEKRGGLSQTDPLPRHICEWVQVPVKGNQMAKIIIGLIAAFYFCIALYMWFVPLPWYNNTPGVTLTGPFNMHFVRDVALVFLSSAGALGYGIWKNNSAVAIAGAAWPSMHGVFHLHMWMMRDFSLDYIAASDISLVMFPAWVALYFSFKLKE